MCSSAQLGSLDIFQTLKLCLTELAWCNRSKGIASKVQTRPSGTGNAESFEKPLNDDFNSGRLLLTGPHKRSRFGGQSDKRSVSVCDCEEEWRPNEGRFLGTKLVYPLTAHSATMASWYLPSAHHAFQLLAQLLVSYRVALC